MRQRASNSYRIFVAVLVSCVPRDVYVRVRKHSPPQRRVVVRHWHSSRSSASCNVQHPQTSPGRRPFADHATQCFRKHMGVAHGHDVTVDCTVRVRVTVTVTGVSVAAWRWCRCQVTETTPDGVRAIREGAVCVGDRSGSGVHLLHISRRRNAGGGSNGV